MRHLEVVHMEVWGCLTSHNLQLAFVWMYEFGGQLKRTQATSLKPFRYFCQFPRILPILRIFPFHHRFSSISIFCNKKFCHWFDNLNVLMNADIWIQFNMGTLTKSSILLKVIRKAFKFYFADLQCEREILQDSTNSFLNFFAERVKGGHMPPICN